MKRGRAHSRLSDEVLGQAADLLIADRKTSGKAPHPGQAEYLDLLRAVEEQLTEGRRAIAETGRAVPAQKNRVHLMPRGLVSRGDLLRALLQQGGELSAPALRALGYDPKPEAPPKPPTTPGGGGTSATTGAGPQPPPEPPAVPRLSLAPASLWLPVSLVPDEIRYPGDRPSRVIPAAPPSRTCGRPSDYRYLASFSQLVPRLRNALSEHRPSRAYDIPRIFARIGRGEYLRRLPLRIRTGWGSNLYVIEDRSDHLAPYVRDQAMVQLHLQRLYPASSFRAAIYSETCSRPEVPWPDGTVTRIDPQPGDQVLVLGDLGCLARDGGRAERFWRAFGEELETIGVAALALLPCAPADCSPQVATYFRLLSWEHPAPPVLTGEELQRRGQELLARLSIASRVEPRLLREMRLALGVPERFPARLETWVWQPTAVTGAGMLATALSDREAKEKRAQLKARTDPAFADATLRVVRDAMRHLPYEIWLETVLNFADRDRQAITDAEWHDALALLDHLADRVAAPGTDPQGPWALEWLKGFYNFRDRFIRMRALTDPVRESFWEFGRAPDWATDWGRDDYGAWASFAVTGKDGAPAVQRMRWIEPGRFFMGSPEDEPKRSNWEGPRHEVRVEEGFWLFDTACTQALWEAVMGENPAFFKGERRPVERVSWNDAQRFVAKLNERIPSLALSLPSEAQWEYACRAGTETALYSGSIDILGERNAPELDAIAWYGGNSGVKYDLDETYDTTGHAWKEMQIPD